MASGKHFKKKEPVPLTPEEGMSQPIFPDGGARLEILGRCGGGYGCHPDHLKRDSMD